MKHVLSLDNFFASFHPFFTWRDGIEVIFFSLIIYTFSLWLKKDNHKNLLGYFYAYCSCFFLAQYAQLTTISHLLFYTAPVGIVLFIIFHQSTLQKNFVTLRALKHPQRPNANWLETLVQLCLVSINNNKEIVCVIEHVDSLADCLTTPLALQADLTKDLLTILTSSPSFNHTHMVWINSQGKLLGVNAQWRSHEHSDLNSSSLDNVKQWRDNALFYTEKTDAVLFKITPAQRLFDIIVHGKTYEHMSASHTIGFITHYLTKAITPAKKGAFSHDNFSYIPQKKSHAQRRH